MPLKTAISSAVGGKPVDHDAPFQVFVGWPLMVTLDTGEIHPVEFLAVTL